MSEISSSVEIKGLKYYEQARPVGDTHRSMKSLSKIEGIPVQHIRICRDLNFNGFEKDNRIHWSILKPQYESNIELIKKMAEESEQDKEDTIGELKKRKIELECIRKELDISQMRKENIPIAEINKFMTVLALQLNGVLTSKIIKELPPLTVGKSEEEIRYICKGAINDVISILKKNIDDWNPEVKK